MLDQGQIDQIIGGTAYASDGDKIGSVGQVYLDDSTGEPAWATVNTGFFGTSESFVPLANATVQGDDLHVPYDKDTVKAAPNVDADGHLDPSDEQTLYNHYSIDYGQYATDSDFVGTGNGYNTSEGYDTSGPTTDDAMTVSEEQVSVGTRTQEAGRARLRKYVVTENVTQTVPVRKEKAVLEREPITDANVGAATSGPDISEEEHEVVLNEEQVVVQKEAVPVERVRLGTEEVVEEATVTEQVRKEQVEAEGDINRR